MTDATKGLDATVSPVMHPLTLRFPNADLERAFKSDYAARSIPQLRAALLAGAVFWCMFGALDHRVSSGGDLAWLRIMRYWIVFPALIGGFWLTLSRLQQFAVRHQQWLVVCVAGVVFGGLASVAARDGIAAEYPRAGLMLAVPLAFAFARLRVPYAAVVAAFAVSSYELAIVVLRATSGFDLFYESLFVVSSVGGGLLIAYALERGVRVEFLQRQEIAAERARSDALLLNVLPAPIADRLKAGYGVIADGFAEVTVLFADITQFTPNSARTTPLELVSILDQVFSRFDELADRHGLEKIKTIGDAYMVVGGLPDARDDHVEAVAEMALEMRACLDDLAWPDGEPIDLRIGIATGAAVAGVIGRRKFAYDLWGDTVNMAARMESHGVPGAIQVTQAVRDALDETHQFEARGEIEVKGIGPVATYLLLGSVEAAGAQRNYAVTAGR